MTDPKPEPEPTEPDVTEDEIGTFFDHSIGVVLLGDGVPADSVAQMRARHIAAVLDSPAAMEGMRNMRRAVPPMPVLLARYTTPDLPDHGPDALPHSYNDIAGCGEDCNNIECPVRAGHDRCTVECLVTAGRQLLFVPAWRRLLLDDDLL